MSELSRQPLAKPQRRPLLRRGLLLALATVAWNVIEGAIAVSSGLVAGSVALVSFGIDSFIETASAGSAAWRVSHELQDKSPEETERVERLTARIAGTLLLILAAFIVIEAVRRLLGYGEKAEDSTIGIILTAVSLLVMPLLGWGKLRIATALGSRTLRADAYETITCAWLSLTTLVGLALNSAFGWWWADPVAALVLVPLVVREGLEGWRGECCECAEE